LLSARHSIDENRTYLVAGFTSWSSFPSRARSSWGIESSEPGRVSIFVRQVADGCGGSVSPVKVFYDRQWLALMTHAPNVTEGVWWR
jgi:hypothetical protein